MTANRALLALALVLTASAFGCASSGSSDREPRYNIIKDEPNKMTEVGIPPDKEAEILLVLQQREVSTRKCYQDVLNEKHDRAFQGTVKVLIALNTTGQATDVKVVGGTLNDQEVQSCLVTTLKGF